MQPLDPSEIEQQLLGTLLVNNRAYLTVAKFLRPEHFGNAVHGRIFDAISKLIGRDHFANPVTVKRLLERDGGLSEIGDLAYLARLAACAKTYGHAERLGRAVHLRGELASLAEDIGRAQTRLNDLIRTLGEA
jgi:replicative DNA helicase